MKSDQTTTLTAFSNSRDIMRMQSLHSAYKKSFAGCTSIHNNVPDLLSIEEVNEHSLFFMTKNVIRLPRLLKREEIQITFFNNISENTNQAAVKDLSSAVISTGMDYINKRENNSWRRLNGLSPLSHPFYNIHDPRYYLIAVVTHRLDDLMRWELNPALIKEYQYLENFISEILKIAHLQFESSTTIGFHYFLNLAQAKVRQMTKVVLTHYTSSSISEYLRNITGLLNSYRNEVAVLLVYLLSNATHSETFDASFLEEKNDLHVEKSFLASDNYNSLRCAYLKMKNQVPLSVNAKGIAELSTIMDKESLCRSVDCYNKVLQLLYTLSSLINTIELLRQSTMLEGEWQAARDETLRLILNTNLKIINEFLRQCQKNANIIYDSSANAAKKMKCIPGFALNVQYAHQKLTVISTIQTTIQDRIQRINQRMNDISDLEEESKEKVKARIIIKTSKLIKKLRSLVSNVSQTEIDKINVLAEKNLGTAKQLSYCKKNFPKLHQLLKHNFAKSNDFEKLISVLHHDININAKKFIDEFTIINNFLKRLSHVNNDISDYLIIVLKNMSLKLNYENYDFYHHSISDFSLPALLRKKKSKTIVMIKTILAKETKQSPEQVSEVIATIKKSAKKKILTLENQFNNIKHNFSQHFSTGKEMIEYYEEKQQKFSQLSAITTTKKQEIAMILLASIELYRATSLENIKPALNRFYQQLVTANYVLHYYGGETIYYEDQTRTVPRHIKKMVDHYQQNIDKDNSLVHYHQIRTKMLNIAETASQQQSMWPNFFKARDISTQQTYQAIVEGSKT